MQFKGIGFTQLDNSQLKDQFRPTSYKKHEFFEIDVNANGGLSSQLHTAAQF